jgi:hypothetical protein
MAYFEVNGFDVSLLVDRLDRDQREQVYYDGSRLNGPSPIINIVAAMDLPQLRKDDLVEYAATKRFRLETGGLAIGEMSVKTDRESQALINGAYNRAMADPAKVTKFKGANGWVTLSGEQVIAIGEAVGDHVANCFAQEEAVAADIASGSITTREQVDAAFGAAP